MGVLWFKKRVCVTIEDGLKKVILEVGHKSRLSLQKRNKMYKDLKESFWWLGTKKGVVYF